MNTTSFSWTSMGWRLVSGRQLLATLLVLAGVTILCGLGVWQINRLNQRLAHNAQINAQMSAAPLPLTGGVLDPEAMDYRRVVVRGVFDPTQELLLRNRSLDGETGYHVLTPLRLTGSRQAVIVDRGWIPLTYTTPDKRARFAPPTGEVTLEGVARRSQESTGGPQDLPFTPERPRLDAWFRVNIPRIEQQVGYPLLPVFVELQSNGQPPDALPIPGTTTDLGPGSHLVYAIQWFSFAGILLIGYLAVTYQQMQGRMPMNWRQPPGATPARSGRPAE